MAERAIRNVCVVGGGLVACSAALAFARALPQAQVSLLPIPRDPSALSDRMPGSLPAIHRFHAALGMDELDLVRDGTAIHLLGTRFENWSASGEPWLHVFGDYGMPAGGAPFHSVWQRAWQQGRALPFHHYAAAAVLAEAGKFAHPGADPQSPLGTFLYALRLDPVRYQARLEAAAEPLACEAGEIDGIERREDGGIGTLRLVDGRRIEADLFLDCTGPSARLLSTLNPDFESWSDWLPCDRITFVEGPVDKPSACDRVRGGEYGWQVEARLTDRTLTAKVWSSRFGAEVGDDAISIRPGRRRDPWIRNVLALGDSAVSVDPLHGTNLHLAQSAILRALELLPGRDCHPLELREYVRRTDQEVTRVRDFLALHYLRSGRSDSPFWTSMAGRQPPASLALTIDQFQRRGRLPFFEEESFDRQSWLAALLGLGMIPEDAELAAGGVDLDQATAAMDALAARLAALAQRFPPYAELLAKMRSAPPPGGQGRI